jgi:hypothetical protein
MLCRCSRDPRLLSAVELASRAQQELRLSQSAASQRFMDSEAAWRHQIEAKQAATESALKKVHTLSTDLERSKASLHDALGLLQQADADRQLLTQQMRDRELAESEKINLKLRDLYRQIDEDAGEREVNMQMLIAKDEEIERLRAQMESLRCQVQSPPPSPWISRFLLSTKTEFVLLIH